MGNLKLLLFCFLACYSFNLYALPANNENKSILDCPMPIYPGGGYIPLLPLMDWTDIKGATCYHLQVSLLSNFSINVIDVIVTRSNYQVIIPLLPLTLHHWRVSTCDGLSFGSFCWVSSFFTGLN